MHLFKSLSTKVQQWIQDQDQQINKNFLSLQEKSREINQNVLHIKGVDSQQWCFLFKNYLTQLLLDRHHVVICSSADEAEEVYEHLKNLDHVHLYPGLNHSLYSSILSSETALMLRFSILNHLLHHEFSLIITTLDAACLLGPDVDFFKTFSFSFQEEDIISPDELASKLISLGYTSMSSIEEPGTFAKKGEIFDIYPLSHKPVRLHYFDDLIEHIHEIDLETHRTKKESTFSKVTIIPAPGFFTDDLFHSTLRSNIPQPQPIFKNKYEKRKDVFRKLGDHQLFENYPVFTPLFFAESKCLFDFLPIDTKISFFNYEQTLKNFEILLENENLSFKTTHEDVESSVILPSPEHFFISPDFITQKLPEKINHILHIDKLNITPSFEHSLSQDIHLHLEDFSSYMNSRINQNHSSKSSHFEFIKSSFKYLKNKLTSDSSLIIVYQTETAKSEIEFLLEENGLLSPEIGRDKITFLIGKLEKGFYYKNEKVFVLSEGNIFSSKKKKTKKVKQSNPDLFAEQLATLKVNDYVIHRDYGVGIYKGLESITTQDQKNDFLILLYENNDKVYVPVYKLHLIQKHADSTAGLKIASLKSKKFNELKQKAKSSIKKLAFDLIKLQAERKLRGGHSYSAPDHLYKEFELSFPYQETPDQLKAIEDVLDDMQAEKSMDRLICGDVGFGKTEVAMRAAMKAVIDKKQVIVLVPTTVLALQHYHSFIKRFEKFPIHIDFVSRFKTPKEKNLIFKQLEEGKIDILIGTHAVLSDKIKYHDLGLLIIDEEHRFGVAHKEKLKVLRNHLDVLTMTATPIPRTLQLSFLGIRDLSLIQTAPPKRQSIKTYIIKEDDLTLKSAIEKELSRGGQVYYVHNRVHDIEEHEIYLKKLVPHARISVTHGQMKERELEKKINEFYAHKSDILLATTIIESGIDIPNANTMIIDRADTYGLAQLHQLRGRIGRSERKAYAYFMIPEQKLISENAQKRLHALQTYAEMGSGFALASSDMEIRGAGDILGAEQSGHIDAIGLEFYMDLLEEAIHEIKGEEQTISVKNIEIQAPFSAFIPNTFIADHSLRLKYYKRLSNSRKLESLEHILEEIEDSFGHYPKEFSALTYILKSRIIFQPLGIKLVKVFDQKMILYFDKEIINQNNQLREKMISYFMSKPKLYKMSPDFSVTAFFKNQIDHEVLLHFAKHIAADLRP